MKLYQLTAFFDFENPADVYFNSREAADKEIAELKRSARKSPRRGGNGLNNFSLERFTLYPAGFKETVLRSLNRRGYVLGTVEVLVEWKRPRAWEDAWKDYPTQTEEEDEEQS
jgi:hypothetical protein